MEHAFLADRRGTGLLKSTLFSLLFSFVFGLILLLASGAILLYYQNPTHAFQVTSTLLPALTAFFGGIIAGKTEKKQGALAGILHGILFVLFLFLLSRLLGEGDFSVAHTLISYTVMLVLSVLGGTVGAAKRQKGKKRRHKRR